MTYVLFGRLSKDLSPEDSLLDSSKGLLWRHKGGARLHKSFCNKNQGDRTSKDSVQFSCSLISDSATPWTAALQASLAITNSQSLPKPMSFESVMSSNHLILCHPLLPSVFPSIRVFSNVALHIRCPKYWSFGFSISPSNEYSGLVSFRIDWLDLLAVQGTLKSPPTPQFKSISSSVLSFMVQLTTIHDYRKNHSCD